MLTVISYKQRKTEEGTNFYVLEVQSGIEMVKSQISSKYYATAKKCFIPSTFDEATCKSLVGTQIDGKIVKEECEPYECVIKETGEVLQLNHRYVYQEE